MATFAERVFEEGKLEGIEETLEAMELIDKGWNNETIHEKTGLSLEVIVKLRKRTIH